MAAERYFRTISPDHPIRLEYKAQGKLAKNLSRQGRLVEAEVVARDALLKNLKTVGKMNRITALIAVNLARILSAQGRYQDAANRYRAVIDIYETTGSPASSLFVGSAKIGLANTFVRLGKWGEALKQFDQIRSDMRNNAGVFEKLTRRSVNHPLALIKSNRAEDAIALLAPRYQDSLKTFGPKRTQTARQAGMLGMAYTALGDKSKAIAAFRGAVPILLVASAKSGGEGSGRAAKGQALGVILDS